MYRELISPELNRMGRESDPSHWTSAEIKTWVYTSIPPHTFMAYAYLSTEANLCQLRSRGQWSGDVLIQNSLGKLQRKL